MLCLKAAVKCRHFCACAIFFSLVYVQSTVFADDEADKTKKVILKTFSKQVDAWNSGDLEAFMETYWNSPQLTFSAGGKTTRGWKATLERYQAKYSSKEKMGRLSFKEFEVTLFGESGALALGRWYLDREKDNLEGNFSVVMKKIDGRWLIIHDHSSSLEKD